MFPDRPRLQIPVVVRKNGEKFIPAFPVTLEAGDQFIIAREEKGIQVDRRRTLNGYTYNGPVLSD